MPNFTPITTGAPANASIVNAPLYQLDSAITTLQASASTVAALQAAVGNMALASTPHHVTVDAINDLWSLIAQANVLIVQLFNQMGNMTVANTNSHVVSGAINELKGYIDSLFTLVGNLGSVDIFQQITFWVACEAYQMTAITYHVAYTNTIASATIVWPDGTTGTFTTTVINPTWEAIDAYNVTHGPSFGTHIIVTQDPVIRNSDGNIIAAPALRHN